MNDILSQIKQFSVIVADTGDFESIRKYQPRDTTTNPSLLLKAAQMPEYAAVLERALADARQESPDPGQTLGIALDKLAIAFGIEILKIIDRKSTRLNSSHDQISYAVFCLKKKKAKRVPTKALRTPQGLSFELTTVVLSLSSLPTSLPCPATLPTHGSLATTWALLLAWSTS